MDENNALSEYAIRSHLVTIVPMAPFTLKSTSKLRSALHIRYSIVISHDQFISCANILLNPNNYYNHGFPNTFDYNHYVHRYYLVCSVPAIAHILYVIEFCDIIATMKIKGLH